MKIEIEYTFFTVELKYFCRHFDTSSGTSRFDHLTPLRKNLFITIGSDGNNLDTFLGMHLAL